MMVWVTGLFFLIDFGVLISHIIISGEIRVRAGICIAAMAVDKKIEILIYLSC